MASYQISITFKTDTVQLYFEGSLKDGMKEAWAVCSKRKSEPVSITMQKAGATLAHERDGWQTVSPIERIG